MKVWNLFVDRKGSHHKLDLPILPISSWSRCQQVFLDALPGLLPSEMPMIEIREFSEVLRKQTFISEDHGSAVKLVFSLSLPNGNLRRESPFDEKDNIFLAISFLLFFYLTQSVIICFRERRLLSSTSVQNNSIQIVFLRNSYSIKMFVWKIDIATTL